MTSQTSNADNPSPVRVVVIGAGYAGMIATNRFLGSLTEDEQQRITLTVVNERSDFVERIRLHQLAAGSRESVTLPLSGVLHPGADIVVGRARLIDTAAGTVQVEADARQKELDASAFTDAEQKAEQQAEKKLLDVDKQNDSVMPAPDPKDNY